MGRNSRKKMRDRTVYISEKHYADFAHTGRVDQAFLEAAADRCAVTVAARRVKVRQGRIWIERA